MRNLIFSGLLALVLAGFVSTAGAQIPGGSYQQTCRDIAMSGSTLYATCLDVSGYWQRSQLWDVYSCSSQIINDNGSLRCETVGNFPGHYPGNYQPGYGYNYPSGSYVQTCQNIGWDGRRLTAVCQRRDGGWRNTSLDYADQCRAEIANIDGRLTCGAAGGGYNYGYGYDSYVQTCQDIRTYGDRIDATCQKRDGSWRRTSLDRVSQCRSEITNENGRLRCTR